MTVVKCGQFWSSLDAVDPRTRQSFEIMSIDLERQRVAVRYYSQKGQPLRGGTKSLRTLQRGMRGSRLEKDSDGSVPTPKVPRRTTLARANHYATVAENSTASDYRRLKAPKWMSAQEKRKWLEENGAKR